MKEIPSDDQIDKALGIKSILDEIEHNSMRRRSNLLKQMRKMRRLFHGLKCVGSNDQLID